MEGELGFSRDGGWSRVTAKNVDAVEVKTVGAADIADVTEGGCKCDYGKDWMLQRSGRCKL